MKNDLTDRDDWQLMDELQTLVVRESQITAKVLLYLAEMERRKLHVHYGYSSLFGYCTKGPLRYSETQAISRIRSARLIDRYPELIPLFATKKVNVTTLSMIYAVLTDENAEELIRKITGASKKHVQDLVARLKPETQVAESTRTVAVTCASTGSDINDLEELIEFKFALPKEYEEHFEELKSILSNKYPKGIKISDVFQECMEVAMDKLSPKRREARREKRKTKVKRAKNKVENTRHVELQLRDRIDIRDERCCTYVGPDGTVCGSKHQLELHHIKPFAKGGKHSVDNLTLRCRTHNQYEAERDFTTEWMDRWRKRTVGG